MKQDMPIVRAYFDTNVFIVGINELCSNSRLALEAANAGKFSLLSSFHIFDELDNWFRAYKSRSEAFRAVSIVANIANEVAAFEEIKKLLISYKDVVPEDDLPHLCAAKALGADMIISTNRHFLEEQNIIKTKTPKEFVAEVLKLHDYFKINA